jgi:hypothetical protein
LSCEYALRPSLLPEQPEHDTPHDVKVRDLIRAMTDLHPAAFDTEITEGSRNISASDRNGFASFERRAQESDIARCPGEARGLFDRLLPAGPISEFGASRQEIRQPDGKPMGVGNLTCDLDRAGLLPY